jgi:hypothetical protein
MNNADSGLPRRPGCSSKGLRYANFATHSEYRLLTKAGRRQLYEETARRTEIALATARALEA